MYGRTTQDMPMAAGSRMNDFGAATQYKTDVSRGDYLGVPQNLVSAPKNTANVYNIEPMMVVQQLPKQTNQRPLQRLKSHYTFLPTQQQF